MCVIMPPSSLDDICKGVTKRMKISRRVVAGDGTARKEEKVQPSSIPPLLLLQVLTINVKPGWKSGTKITFQREGDQVRMDGFYHLVMLASGSEQDSCRYSLHH